VKRHGARGRAAKTCHPNELDPNLLTGEPQRREEDGGGPLGKSGNAHNRSTKKKGAKERKELSQSVGDKKSSDSALELPDPKNEQRTTRGDGLRAFSLAWERNTKPPSASEGK